MFKTSQVLRTAKAITSESGKDVPAKTRVVVMEVKSGTVRAKVSDSTRPEVAKEHLVAMTSDFTATHRGRPKKGA